MNHVVYNRFLGIHYEHGAAVKNARNRLRKEKTVIKSPSRPIRNESGRGNEIGRPKYRVIFRRGEFRSTGLINRARRHQPKSNAKKTKQTAHQQTPWAVITTFRSSSSASTEPNSPGYVVRDTKLTQRTSLRSSFSNPSRHTMRPR